MEARRHRGVRNTVVLGIVGLLSAALVAAQPASANGQGNAFGTAKKDLPSTTQTAPPGQPATPNQPAAVIQPNAGPAALPVPTNYYNASVSPGIVRYVTSAANATAVTVTVGNCGRATSPPATCTGSGSPAIRSIALTAPTGWTVVLGPGSGWIQANSATVYRSLVVPLSAGQPPLALPAIHLMPSTTGAGVPQTLTMCVDSTFACMASPFAGSFRPIVADPTVELPLRFTFVQSPVTGIPTTSVCGTSVQLTDAPAGTDTVPLAGVAVTLAAATGSLDPGLDTTVSAPTSNAGQATFGGCTPTPAVGGPYQIVAQHSSPTIPSDSSNAFLVYTNLKECTSGGSCQSILTGKGDTRLDTTTNSAGPLGTSVFDALDSHFPSFDCGLATVDGRPDVLQATSNGDKTVVITWSKQVTHKFTDTGTPHWEVCMQAPATFITDSGAPATHSGAYYFGTVPLCRAGGLPANNPCMALSRNRSQESATITLPAGWTGDPYFH
jgi:hypothetical protein